jgi:hypothetical protein
MKSLNAKKLIYIIDLTQLPARTWTRIVPELNKKGSQRTESMRLTRYSLV